MNPHPYDNYGLHPACACSRARRHADLSGQKIVKITTIRRIVTVIRIIIIVITIV